MKRISNSFRHSMDCRRQLFAKLVLLIICTVQSMNIFQPKYFCGSLLADTLKKYNCIYHEIRGMDYVVDGSGIVKDCCFDRCSEYNLVKSYCSHSDLDSTLIDLLTTPKTIEVISEIHSFSDNEPRNITQKHVSKPIMRKQPKALSTEVSRNKNKNGRNKKYKRGNTKVKVTNIRKLKVRSNRKRDCACSCFKTRGATNNKDVIFKSPVVGVTNFSRNSVIRLAGFRNNRVFRL